MKLGRTVEHDNALDIEARILRKAVERMRDSDREDDCPVSIISDRQNLETVFAVILEELKRV